MKQETIAKLIELGLFDKEPTFDEVWEKLPKGIKPKGATTYFKALAENTFLNVTFVSYQTLAGRKYQAFIDDSPTQAAADLLIWVKENGYL